MSDQSKIRQLRLMLSDNVIFIDTLGTSGEYLVWEDGKFFMGEAGVR